MDFARIFKEIARAAGGRDMFGDIETELDTAIAAYWSMASVILRGSSINLAPLVGDYASLEKNFFSALFLYSYRRAGISRPRRILYATINQALRGLVTGCDNILDDEYKPTLETDLPAGAARFRSIIDMLVSDRVIFEVLTDGAAKGELTNAQAVEASRATLGALALSGAQEASEEHGIAEILTPDAILARVHHYKTGILFQAPWAVPAIIEGRLPSGAVQLKDALYNVGMGCQIIDDMVDMPIDIKRRRHNYAVSSVLHGTSPEERGRLVALRQIGAKLDASAPVLLDLPLARVACAGKAYELLRAGLDRLFADEDAMFVEPAIRFLVNRLSAGRLMTGVAL